MDRRVLCSHLPIRSACQKVPKTRKFLGSFRDMLPRWPPPAGSPRPAFGPVRGPCHGRRGGIYIEMPYGSCSIVHSSTGACAHVFPVPVLFVPVLLCLPLSSLAPHHPQGCHSVPTYRGTHGIYSVFGRLYAAIGSGSTLGSESAAGSAADSSEVE